MKCPKAFQFPIIFAVAFDFRFVCITSWEALIGLCVYDICALWDTTLQYMQLRCWVLFLGDFSGWLMYFGYSQHLLVD